MGKIAIVTDSNSGITQKEGKELGISVIPMPFYINEELYFEDITLTQDEFYQKLNEDEDIKTSQPAPGDVLDLWEKLLEDHDEIVHIAMSSGLSSSCATAAMLADDYDGKVQVVDNQRISVTQRQSVLDAAKLAEEGKSAKEIKDILEADKLDSGIYIMVDTLKYLKKDVLQQQEQPSVQCLESNQFYRSMARSWMHLRRQEVSNRQRKR